MLNPCLWLQHIAASVGTLISEREAVKTVTVTDADIEEATKRRMAPLEVGWSPPWNGYDPDAHNPVALAFMRETGKKARARRAVFCNMATIYEIQTGHSHWASASMAAYLSRWHRQVKATPHTFRLEY